MKKIILILIVLFSSELGNSQDLDLIVKSSGDSIACRIDSISDTHVYFTLKSNKQRVTNSLAKTDLIKYERNAIDKNSVILKQGSSTVLPHRESLPRNSVYIGIMTLSYARSYPVNKAHGTIAGGIAFMDGLGLYVESTMLIGNNKHFFEPGLLGFGVIDLSTGKIDEAYDYRLLGIAIRTGYRYQAPKGFLFRIAPMFYFYDGYFAVYPGASLGYSF